MNRSGDTVSQMVDDYILTKQAVFEKIVESMFIVTGISQEALGARFSEKSYIIDRSPNDWEIAERPGPGAAQTLCVPAEGGPYGR